MTLAGPLVLVQAVFFAAVVFWPWREASGTLGRLPVQMRMLLSFSLVVVAIVIWLWQRGPEAVYGQWVAFGMVASFVGDLLMARVIPFPNRLIGGMIAFGIAHALYITAYVQTIQTISALEPYSRWTTGLAIGLVVYGTVALLGWWFLIRNPEKGTVVSIGALIYGLWISVMASYAFALAGALGAGFWLTALGGLFFLSSDFIIGMTDIHGIQLKNANVWVWLTYMAGQMGIIYAGAVG